MSAVGFLATLVAGATLGIIAVGLAASAHDCRQTATCALCQDTGATVATRPDLTTRWCTCVLGRQLAAQALAQARVSCTLDLPDGA